MEKEQTSANKEAKAEGKKGLRESSTIMCGNCLKTDTDVGFKLSMCSKCNSAYYCSRECQVEDWPKHKSMCNEVCEFKKNKETSFDSSGINARHLLRKWITKSKIDEAAYYALKKEGIEQQPPLKVVLVEVEFNYNAQTFIVKEVPRAVAITDLDPGDQDDIRETLQDNREKTAGEIDQVYHHLLIIYSRGLGERHSGSLPIAIWKSRLDQMNAAHIDMYRIRTWCAQIHLKSDLFRGWNSIRRRNLQKQIEKMNLGQSYTAFVQNALQFFCNKSLQNTHQIIVNMKMGRGIGQISQFLEYHVVPIAESKKFKEAENFFIHVEDTESRSRQYTEMAILVETFFVDPDTSFAFDFVLHCEVNVTQNKTANQCKKAADKYFRKLQQEVKEMPSDLLEKVSL